MITDVAEATTGRGFPEGFLWGVASAAYQVEGAVREDGRGWSIWDTFSHTPGKVRRGDTGDIACDGYHRLESDLDLMLDLGVGAYRFSVSWPRIQPTGTGPPNTAGLDFYKRLVDGLHARGIVPVLTLYHWDLPQPLEDAGGWPLRATAERFAEFSAIVARALGDGVKQWITVNEPSVAAGHGYRLGVHAPGRTEPAAGAAATHHLLLAHGLAMQALRAELPRDHEIGITMNLTVVRAGEPDLEQVARAVAAETNDLYLDPVLDGTYPTAGVRRELVPPGGLVLDGDMETISAPGDFLGVNYYRPVMIVRRDGDEEPMHGEEVIEGHPGIVGVAPKDQPLSSMDWPMDASGFFEVLMEVHHRVPGLPLYVTENGMAAEDYVDPEGGVDDHERIEYLREHLHAGARAIEAGVALRGYFCWSFLDNFEWAEGYQKRFGLVYVDYPTQQRIPKASAGFYSEVMRSNTVPS